MDFMNAIKNELNSEKTVTTNGAVAYRTAGSVLLDFNFAISAMRNMDEDQIISNFIRVYHENPKLAVKYLFYIGDVREGLGERKVFRTCLHYLVVDRPDIAKVIVKLIPEYNRWDTLVQLVDLAPVRSDVVDIITAQLQEDMINMSNGKSISLLAKWMPSENTSSAVTRALASKVRMYLGLSAKKYRKMLSALRKYSNVVETKMSSNKWSEINYESVPSKANLNYKDAFMRHDMERRTDFLNSLVKGEVKINAGVAQPHDIVSKYISDSWYGGRVKAVDVTLEEMWKNLPNLSVENTLVVRDGSGSMTWGSNGTKPLDIATALAVYMAQHNTGAWKDKYITFSANPKIVDISNCETLRDALEISYAEADCSNTNIYKTMRLVLDTAINNHMTQADMPKTIVICSDMQFDGRWMNFDKSLFDRISDEFVEAGYQLPRICFWNLAGEDHHTVPMQQNDLGLILCSSFSVQILKMFMSGNLDPYEILVEQINSARYDAVDTCLTPIFG